MRVLNCRKFANSQIRKFGCALLVLPITFGSAHAQKPVTFAQRLVDETVKLHPEVKGMELVLTRGEGCVTIAATDKGDVGDRCDGHEIGLLRTGETKVEEPSRKDPVYDVTQALHDASGTVIGLVMMDLAPSAGKGREQIVARAAAILQELQSHIPSAAHLGAGAPSPDLPAADANYNPRIEPGNFVTAVTNPYYPLVPGTTYRYQGTGDMANETNTVEVTHDTKTILGVRATIVLDRVFEDGELAEETLDWYAQDKEGNVWYLGEDSREYKNGQVVSTHGSWEAGVNGAQPGIIMWADPARHVGQSYRQEYLPGSAEDMGKVVALRESVTVPFGSFKDCIRTQDTTPLEPKVHEEKLYCRGVGFVREIESKTAGADLVAVEKR